MASLHLNNAGEPDTTEPMTDLEVVETQAEAEKELQQQLSISSPISSNSPHTLSISPILQNHPLSLTSESPSIIISNFEDINATISESSSSSNGNRLLQSQSQRHSTRSFRFTPYSGASKSVHIRRSSLPDNWKETTRPKLALPGRPSTVSPKLPSSELCLQDVNINVIPKLSSLSPLPVIRSLPPPPPPPPASSKSIHVDIENCPDVPISSFARRKTPQSSPTTTNFRQRRRSGSFSPVLLPTLLPGLHSSSSSSPSRLSSPDMANLCEAVTTRLTATDRPRIVRQQQGLRLSSYRSFYIEDKSRRVISAG